MHQAEDDRYTLYFEKEVDILLDSEGYSGFSAGCER